MIQQSTTPKSQIAQTTDAIRSRRTVVMGQGVITPAVREHLGKSAKAVRALPKAAQAPTGR